MKKYPYILKWDRHAEDDSAIFVLISETKDLELLKKSEIIRLLNKKDTGIKVQDGDFLGFGLIGPDKVIKITKLDVKEAQLETKIRTT